MVNILGSLVEEIHKKTDIKSDALKPLPVIDLNNIDNKNQIIVDDETLSYLLANKLNQSLDNIEGPYPKELNGLNDIIEEVNIKYEGEYSKKVKPLACLKGKTKLEDIITGVSFDVTKSGSSYQMTYSFNLSPFSLLAVVDGEIKEITTPQNSTTPHSVLKSSNISDECASLLYFYSLSNGNSNGIDLGFASGANNRKVPTEKIVGNEEPTYSTASSQVFINPFEPMMAYNLPTATKSRVYYLGNAYLGCIRLHYIIGTNNNDSSLTYEIIESNNESNVLNGLEE